MYQQYIYGVASCCPQHLSYITFSAVLMTTVKLYKTIFRFNLPVDHRKFISPLSTEFIIMELRLQCVCVYWCIVIFLQVDYCLLKPQKRLELNWFNVTITATGILDKVASYCFLETVSCKYSNSQIVPLDISEKKNLWKGQGVAAYAYF